MAAIDDRLTQLATAIGDLRDSVPATGVRASNADNTAALEALANLHKSNTGKVTRINLPPGVVRGHLPWAPGIEWVGNGTVLSEPSGGWTKHIIGPLDPESIGAVDGSGGNWGALTGRLVIDGKSAAATYTPLPQPAQPTCTAATGTINAATYGGWLGYRIAFKSSVGIGSPSPTQNVAVSGTTAGAKIDWVIPTGATTAQIVVYGRGPWAGSDWWILAVLPAGTTTWTDTGAVTPGTNAFLNGAVTPYQKKMFEADLSAPSFVVTGGCTTVSGDILVRQIPGTGFASWWDYESMPGDGVGWELMEGKFSGLRIEAPGCDGIQLNGPHDTILKDFEVSRPGRLVTDLRDGLTMRQRGPYVVKNCHIWGKHGKSITATGYFDLDSALLEGFWESGLDVQDRAQIGQVQVFFPGTTGASIKGVVFKSAVVNVTGLLVEGFTASHGAAIDMASLPAGSFVHATVRQDAGTAVTPPSVANREKSSINVMVAGSLSAQSIRPAVADASITDAKITGVIGAAKLGTGVGTTPGSKVLYDDGTYKTAPTGGGTTTVDGLTDATNVGKAVVKATDKQTARSALGFRFSPTQPGDLAADEIWIQTS